MVSHIWDLEFYQVSVIKGPQKKEQENKRKRGGTLGPKENNYGIIKFKKLLL